MKRLVFLVISSFLLAVVLPAKAQSRHGHNHHDTVRSVFGHVVQKGTHKHIPYINVVVKGTTIGTVTDTSGHYFLTNLPSGELTIEASYIGYAPQAKHINLHGGETLELDFEMQEQTMRLDGVVVSANRIETKQRYAPALISVITPEIFNITNSVSLSDGLSFQPGLRVEDNCQNSGFTQVRINGLDGHYSQILINSHPVISALAGVYGLEQIPTSMIERVEVLRGGGSALFGASAIGGTINVITKDPERNSAEASHTITSIGISPALDNVTTANASLVKNDGKAGLYVYGQNRHRSAYDHDGDGFSDIPTVKGLSFGMNSFLKTGKYSRLALQYSGMDEYRRGGDRLNRPPHEALVAEQTDYLVNLGSLSFDISTPDLLNRFSTYFSFNNTGRKSYFGADQDLDAYGRTHDLTLAAGAQYVRSFKKLWFLPADLTVGVEYNYNYLKDESLGYDQYTLQKVNIYSLYAQNEWKNEKWSILIGCRMDKHNLIKRFIFSPRANIRFNPIENVSLRVSYSSGFRAPQAFDEDMHVAIVAGERVAIRLADNLKEERSHSVNISADLYHTFGTVQTNLLIEGFYTTLNNVFVLRETETVDPSGALVKERTNGSGATVMGLNIEGKLALPRWVQFQLGVTLQRSRYKKAEQWSDNPEVPAVKRMFRTPDLYGYLTATVTPVKHFDISLSGTYTGSMLVQHMESSGTPVDVAVRTPRFFDLNIKLAYEFTIARIMGLEINCGVKNIFNAYQRDFDKGPDRDSDYIYGPALPRSLFAGIKINF